MKLRPTFLFFFSLVFFPLLPRSQVFLLERAHFLLLAKFIGFLFIVIELLKLWTL